MLAGDCFNDQIYPLPDLMITSLSLLQTKIVKKSWYITHLLDRVSTNNVARKCSNREKIAWDNIQKSLYIETIILGFPLHQIILVEIEESDNYIVIDGDQRINALISFYGGKHYEANLLRLQNLRIRTELNGMTYEDIQCNEKVPDITATFDRNLIDIAIVKNCSSIDIIQEIQTRINA